MPKVNTNGFPILTAGVTFATQIDGNIERMTFRRSTVPFLASRLQSVLARNRNAGQTILVTDRTGITGQYDFQLAIPAPSPRSLPPLSGEAGQDAPGVTASDSDVGPAGISAAMEKQLGLKLKPVKISLDFIVVDRVERVPTEN